MYSTSDIPNVWTVSRNPLISLWRGINTALDVTFYDVEALSRDEKEKLSRYSRPEGSIVVVYPGGTGKEIRYMSPLDFVSSQENNTADPVDALVVTGVGSSVLGTAALARNVADYLGRPVGGIVSGLGMSDVMTEAFGGWAILGAKNAMRDFLARMLDAMDIKDHVRDQATHEDIDRHFAAEGIDRNRFIYGSPDSTALLYVLTKLRSRIKLLVGHSKGNYSIVNALEGWVSASDAAGTEIPPDLMIITLGAVIWLPKEFKNVCQLIGQLDLLGMLNSRLSIDCVRVPWASHSLNRLVVGNICVSDALKTAGIVK